MRRPFTDIVFRWGVRSFRLLLLAAVAALLYLSSHRSTTRSTLPLSIAREFFPSAHVIGTLRVPSALGDDADGAQSVPTARREDQAVYAADGQLLGYLLMTSPDADDLVGYAGPSNVLVAITPDQRIAGLKLLSSADTLAHVEEVRGATNFWQQFVGWKTTTAPPPRIEGVSGSTLTSLAIAEGVLRRLHGAVPSLRFPQSVSLDEVQPLFPQAMNLKADEPRPGWHSVCDAAGNTLGFVVRTAPYADNIRGYRGPTEALAVVSVDGRTVTDIRLRQSYDTDEYVSRVREDDDFRRLLSGRTTAEWARIDFAAAGIEGVSGATQTSYAVAEGLRRRFAADAEQARRPATRRAPFAAWGLIAVIVGSLAITFTPLRSSRRVRTVWQALLVMVFALWLGDLLSVALLVGWSRHGVPWQAAPSLGALVVVALVTPWATRRQIYCQSICPHGAAQELLGKWSPWRMPIPLVWQDRLRIIPAVLLGFALLVAIAAWPFDLAWLEPFDGWALRWGAPISLAVLGVGLVASFFVPQAYCRFGCPTGELLRLMKSSGSGERLQRRDCVAAAVVLVAGLIVGWNRWQSMAVPPQPVNIDPAEHAATIRWEGPAFGSRWSVTFREPPPAELEQQVNAELARIEQELSHWHEKSATSQFNAAETTFALEQPQELIDLVLRAQELSRRSQGMYDITVAPLVQAWGYGPGTPPKNAPTDEELDQLRARVGWEKLLVDAEAQTLQKVHPQLQIDLGSLLQGYAADRVAALLDAAGVKEFLIDVGGELFARGEWNVAIENPRDAQTPLRIVALRDQALATSGLYRGKRDGSGGRVHHLISPHTGRPVEATVNLCAVLAPKAVAADGWATALLAVGLPEALTLADENRLTVLLLDGAGETHVNDQGRWPVPANASPSP